MHAQLVPFDAWQVNFAAVEGCSTCMQRRVSTHCPPCAHQQLRTKTRSICRQSNVVHALGNRPIPYDVPCRVAACLLVQAPCIAGAAASPQAAPAAPASNSNSSSRVQPPATLIPPVGSAQMAQWLSGAACEASILQLLLAEPTRETTQQRHMLQALVSVRAAACVCRRRCCVVQYMCFSMQTSVTPVA
jgi:hypothetical protein